MQLGKQVGSERVNIEHRPKLYCQTIKLKTKPYPSRSLLPDSNQEMKERKNNKREENVCCITRCRSEEEKDIDENDQCVQSVGVDGLIANTSRCTNDKMDSRDGKSQERPKIFRESYPQPHHTTSRETISPRKPHFQRQPRVVQ
jgi:hypothetical protein